ncbi:MAG: LPS export ABC transporter permease LptF [Cellvibrionales bacterium]|nr:LPS export ABC transporter permease LptF [Cellvibrionales bacterium]
MRLFFYLTKEVFTGFFGVLTILLFIFLSGRFVKHLASAASGQFPADIIFSIMLYRLPEFLEILLPLSLFLGLMLAFGRLYVESEMVVLQACGISKRRLLFLSMSVCLPLMIAFAVITLYLTPLGLFKYQKLWEKPENTMSFSTLVSGSFKTFGGKMTLYAGDIKSDKSQISDVFTVMTTKNAESIDILKAESAQLTYGDEGGQYLELHQGFRVSGGDNGLNYRVSQFNTLGRLVEEEQHISKEVTQIDALPTTQLFEQSTTQAKAKLQWRFGLPFMIPIIAIIGLAFSETNHRKGRYIKLIPGIILYFVYFGCITFAYNQMESGNFPSALGLWPIHLVFLGLGLAFFYYNDIKRLIRNDSH